MVYISSSISPKSTDGGIATSTARACAVVKMLASADHGGSAVPRHLLHPQGLGCTRPEVADRSHPSNRRVEIGVLSDKEVLHAY
jgi:flagellar motor protein MotB